MPVPGDYDGDGIMDVAVWRPSTSTWCVLPSKYPGTYWYAEWGCASCGDIPVPGDYDGDNVTDYAVWHSSNGQWRIFQSSDGASQTITWGSSGAGDIPMGNRR